MDQSTVFTGMNGFTWWVGVVENRNDPLNLCRCQIRIFGWHTADKNLIPTSDLPWAQPIFPVNSSDEAKTPLEGDWVIGFFFDGPLGQAPVYFGVMPGIPVGRDNNPQKGFTDPRTNQQLENAPKGIDGALKRNPRYPGEPTTSRLYRNEKISETIIGRRNNSLTKNVKTADGKTWSEPASAYAAVPPYNDVKETESGHVLEFDDTPKAERINLTHRTGTYSEIRPDGSKVTKVLGKNYEIIAGDDFVNIQGQCNVTIQGNAQIYVIKDAKMKVDGNYDLDVTGHIRMNGKTINLNRGTMGAARIGDVCDTGDAGTGGHFDTNSAGSDKIETGSGTVFIGD
ncbi:MAG: hypothetical protein EBU90_20550 [Proteobacteria bacterium]|nr:hypothetical protein [Pseudomonadota bacterium]